MTGLIVIGILLGLGVAAVAVLLWLLTHPLD
jgi:hypothetical protein